MLLGLREVGGHGVGNRLGNLDGSVGLPFIADDIPVSGFVYDVQTGRLREVVGPTGGRAG